MGRGLQFITAGTAVAAMAAAAIMRPAHWEWIVVCAAAVAIMMLIWVWNTLRRTGRLVQTGMDLIASQEFSNRLVPTGISDTDRIVALFNTMLDTMRGERIKNLEQENFTTLITRASPMGVLMLDLDGCVGMVNPAFLKIIGIRRKEDILGKKLGEIGVPLVGEMAATPLGKSDVIRGGSVMMYRCYHLSFIRNGARCEFFLLESLTEEVMKAEREAYEKVIRTISHEINNTMGGVRTLLQTMSDMADADTADVLDSCDNRCGRLCDFVSAYADVVRLPEPRLAEVDLNAEMTRLMPFLMMMTDESVELSFRPSESPAVVMADTGMLQQALVNIVKNAAESITGPGGRIIIGTDVTPEHVTLRVTNNGIPISEDVSRNIFRPFFTTKKDGRGIGLTLVAEILNRHKTRFSLRTAPDGLTTFSIVF